MLRTAFAIAVVSLIVPNLVAAESLWDKVKDGASDAAGAVSDTAKSLTTKETPEETRQKIDTMATKTLDQLFAEHKAAKLEPSPRSWVFVSSTGWPCFN